MTSLISVDGINYILSSDLSYYCVGNGTGLRGSGLVNGCETIGPIVIPHDVNGKLIREISHHALAFCIHVTSLTVYADLDIIGQDALYFLSGISSIIFFGQVKRIHLYCFSMYQYNTAPQRSSNHSYIVIFKSPMPIENVGNNAFEFTSNLTIYLHSKKMPTFGTAVFGSSSKIKIYGPAKGLTFANQEVIFSPDCIEINRPTCFKKQHGTYYRCFLFILLSSK